MCIDPSRPLPLALDKTIAPAPMCAPPRAEILDLSAIEPMLVTSVIRAIIIEPRRLGT